MSKSSKITIVFTDSGLGGLSIMGEFYNLLLKPDHKSAYDEIEIIFFNALKEYGGGYNTMSSMAEKVSTFNSALEMISEFYKPDYIAIACNTLSSIYSQTNFARHNQITHEIISCGRRQIEKYKQQNPVHSIITLATQTTIDSAAYHFDDPSIIPLSGANLAPLIEFDNTDKEIPKVLKNIYQLIESSVPAGSDIALFLGCTHYGYIDDLLIKTAEGFNFNLSEILNPNNAFARFMYEKIQQSSISSFAKPKINIRIESQAFIDPAEINSISNLIKVGSPIIAKILQNYSRLEKGF